MKWESASKLLLAATVFDLRRPLAIERVQPGQALPRCKRGLTALWRAGGVLAKIG